MGGKLVDRREAPVLRLGDERLKPFVRYLGREVEEGPWRACQRHAFTGADVPALEFGALDSHPSYGCDVRGRNHTDVTSRGIGDQMPKRRRTPVA